MGASHSREGLEIDSDEEDEEYQGSSDHERYEDAEDTPVSSSLFSGRSKSPLDDIEARLKSLKVKYPGDRRVRNHVKLYLYIGGNTPGAKWVVSDKLTSHSFARTASMEDDEGDEDDEGNGLGGGDLKGLFWVLKVGSKVRARVSSDLQLKMFGDQRRVDFACNGVWAMKFFSNEDYRNFVTKFQDCLFENVYGVRATDENKEKVYGKEFIGWVKPEFANDLVWEDAENDLKKSPELSARKRSDNDLVEEFEEAANGGVQSLTLGALDNSFLVNDLGVQVYRNLAHGIRGKGMFVKFGDGGRSNTSVSGGGLGLTPKKAMLMRGETNMMLMSPVKEGKPQATGIQQLDIETGKIVTEWKFEKDGTDITTRDCSPREYLVRLTSQR